MSLGKVLVVDDDNNICELLKLYLVRTFTVSSMELSLIPW